MNGVTEVIKVSKAENLEEVFAIRRKVFVEEQNCPPDLEWEFEDESVHFLAKIKGLPAGAARWRKTENGYKLERFAVLPQFRGRGIAQKLVKATLEDLPDDAKVIYLHGQLSALPLYRKFGFVEESEPFEEAGIQHRKMVLKR